MRWRPYDGPRTPAPGKRTFVEIPPELCFAEPVRKYGYVWQEAGVFRGQYDVLRPGEIEDVRVGAASSEREAKKLVAHRLQGGRSRP